MDNGHRGGEKFDSDYNAVQLGRRKDIFGERYRYSYVHLSGTNLPLAACVTSFMPPQANPRSVDPSSLVALTAAFQQLQRINWPHQVAGFYTALRRQHMKEFVDSISAYTVSPTRKTLDVRIESPEYLHNRRIPNLAGRPGDTSLCDALRDMIDKTSFEKLYYQGPLDPSLFWTGDESLVSDLSTVLEITVLLNLASLSGQWYFKGLPEDDLDDASSDVPLPHDKPGLFPPGYGSAEETHAAIALKASMMQPVDSEGFNLDNFNYKPRRVPRDEAMVPMLEALAHRLVHAPSLKSAYLESRLKESDWFVLYKAPGETSGYEEHMTEELDAGLSRARVFFHAGDWMLADSLVDLFRNAGKVRHGEDAIVTFLPWLY